MVRALFLLLDFFVYILIIFITITLRRMEVNPQLFVANIYAMLPFFPFFTFTLYLFSFYDVRDINRIKPNYGSLLNAVLVNVITGASVLYFLAAPLGMVTPKTILVAILTLYPLYIYFSRRLYIKFSFYKKNIIIFGSSPTLSAIENLLKNSKVYNITAVYPAPAADVKYNTDHLDLVLISSTLFRDNKEAWQLIAEKFIQKGILLKTDLNVYEEIFCRTPKEGLDDAMWLMRGVGGREIKEIYPVIKNLLDLIISLCLLPAILPACVLIYLLIKITDGFDPIFKQERAGYMQKIIYIYKFRTMRPGTEEITKLGALLRRFRLDELPQLFNIIKGDISLVGPRPIWIKEYEILNNLISGHAVRSIVKPGLTGWAQLNFKAPPNYFYLQDALKQNSAQTLEDAFTRFSYDVWYIKNRSFSLDAEILIKTIKRMFIKDKDVSKKTL